jgi:PAS domain S-box-containing protein
MNESSINGPGANSAERALQESEARTRAIFEAAVDAIITIDELGIIDSLNPAAERMFGYSADETHGKNVNMLMPVPYRDEHDNYLRNYLETGVRKVIGIGREVAGRRRDGTVFPMELSVSEVRLGDRRLFTGIVRDITERKKAEEQLRFVATELRERNAELTRSNQELDDFAYIASHDLKEPLRGIHNYATFLIEDYSDKLDDAGRMKLETLQSLTQRMDSLLDSLLEFSRVGRLSFAFMDTDLEQIVGDVLESLRITIQERRIEVRIPKTLPTLLCDRIRVAEVFRNLIGNAFKYNDKPEPWVEIGWVSGSHSGNGSAPETGFSHGGPVTLYVRDNGIGIREKHFEGIFRIFRRLHGRDKYGGGTGAGLTIVKKIIERHGGRIWVESEVGVGTTFFFTLTTGG